MIVLLVDPDTPHHEGVFAKATKEKNGFYPESSCSEEKLIFYVEKDSPVEITDSAVFTKVVKVKYAGVTGYMKKSQLKF